MFWTKIKESITFILHLKKEQSKWQNSNRKPLKKSGWQLKESFESIEFIKKNSHWLKKQEAAIASISVKFHIQKHILRGTPYSTRKTVHPCPPGMMWISSSDSLIFPNPLNDAFLPQIDYFLWHRHGDGSWNWQLQIHPCLARKLASSTFL